MRPICQFWINENSSISDKIPLLNITSQIFMHQIHFRYALHTCITHLFPNALQIHSELWTWYPPNIFYFYATKFIYWKQIVASWKHRNIMLITSDCAPSPRNICVRCDAWTPTNFVNDRIFWFKTWHTLIFFTSQSDRLGLLVRLLLLIWILLYV